MERTTKKFMDEAIRLAYEAKKDGEVPVGAVVVCDGQIVGRGRNEVEKRQNASCHAEMLAIEDASLTLGRWRLSDCEMFVNLEPCMMCAGAIKNARIKRLYFGAYDREYGAALRLSCEVYGGIFEDECKKPLSEFFDEIRKCSQD